MSDQHINRAAPAAVVAPMAVIDVTAPGRWPPRRRVVAGALMVALAGLVAATVGWALAVSGPWLAIETAHQEGRAALAAALAAAAFIRKVTEPPFCAKP